MSPKPPYGLRVRDSCGFGHGGQDPPPRTGSGVPFRPRLAVPPGPFQGRAAAPLSDREAEHEPQGLLLGQRARSLSSRRSRGSQTHLAAAIARPR